MDKRISVIVPVYCAQATIERCVSSLLRGTYRNLEVLLIDDASTDASPVLCQQLAESDQRVKYYRNPINRGVSYTRNVGLANASGELLMFMDSDDWADTDFVSMLCGAYTDTVMPVCGYYNHDEKKNNRTDRFGFHDFNHLETVCVEEGLQILYENRLLQMIWNKIFDRSVIEGAHIRFDESLSCGEDFRFLLDYLYAADVHSFCLLACTPYHYSRDNADSLATRYTEVAVDELMTDLARMFRLMKLTETAYTERMQQEQQQRLSYYAYGYMHDPSLSLHEKKQRVLSLPLANAKKTYRELRILCLKEILKKKLRK